MPSQVCILTDSSVQFPNVVFPGQEFVKVIPFKIQYKEKCYQSNRDIRIQDLPIHGIEGEHPRLIAPSVKEFRDMFTHLARYRQVIVLLLSGHLSPAMTYAREAIKTMKGNNSPLLIDSETCGVGLGLLVQAAAEAAMKGASLTEISQLVRKLISRIYMLFYIRDLMYLSWHGYLDPAQAIVGEMLGVFPLYLLEYGRFIPIHKVRNSRHLMDLLQEFIGEFTAIQHVALIRGAMPFEQEARHLKECVSRDFPGASFSEHLLSSEVASLFGPRSLGLVVLEG